MFLKFFTKARVLTIITMLIVLLLTSLGLFYYFRYFINVDRFPTVESTVNQDQYKENGFKKISYENDSYAFFIPDYWIETDESAQLYGDILNGSSTYFKSYPNTLGGLTNQLCQKYGNDSISKLKEISIYSNASLISKEVRKIKDFEGCYLIAKTQIAGKEYKIRQFFVFRENRIYHLFIRYQTIQTQEDIASMIEKSLIIRE